MASALHIALSRKKPYFPGQVWSVYVPNITQFGCDSAAATCLFLPTRIIDDCAVMKAYSNLSWDERIEFLRGHKSWEVLTWPKWSLRQFPPPRPFLRQGFEWWLGQLLFYLLQPQPV